MIKHIVLFKLKKMVSPEAKNSKLQELKAGFEGLKDKIDVLRSIEVGVNCNPAESFDLVLTTVFDSADNLAEYAGHPDHVAMVRKIGEVKEDRACVDFICDENL